MNADIFILLLFFGTGAGVPGNSLSTEGFKYDEYYDHIIDWGLQKLKPNSQGYSIEASVKQLEPISSEIAVEGTIRFDVIDPIRSDICRCKHLQNGDLDVLSSIGFGNISGTGNFSGLNKESKNDLFEFERNPTAFSVFFMVTRDPSRKRVAFQFDELEYHHSKDFRKNLNLTLLLEPNSTAALNKLFNDLYNIIYERMVLTPRTDSTYFEGVLDKVFKKLSGEKVNITGDYGKTIINGSLINAYAQWLSSNVLQSLTRTSRVSAIKEINGDHDLETTIQFGNVSGIERFYQLSPNKTVDDTSTFMSPPVVIKAFLYVPRNKSLQAITFSYLTNPNYTIQTRNEKFRINFQVILKKHGAIMYFRAADRILDEVQNEVFPDGSVTNNN